MKKLHKRWLYWVVDVSQDSAWRKRLFDAKPNEVFRIWACSTEGLPPNVVSAVRKYKLNYSVRVAAPDEYEPWLSENGAILFKFWATDFEELTCFTGNNPGVRQSPFPASQSVLPSSAAPATLPRTGPDGAGG